MTHLADNSGIYQNPLKNPTFSMSLADSVKIIAIMHQDKYANAETQTPKSNIPQLKQKMEGQLPHKFLHIPVHRKKRSRQCVREVARVEQRCNKLNEFIKRVEEQITMKWGHALTHAQLLEVARGMSKEFDINIDRDATRRKKGLLAWCAEHIVEFVQYISTLRIEEVQTEAVIELGPQTFDDIGVDMFTDDFLSRRDSISIE